MLTVVPAITLLTIALAIILLTIVLAIILAPVPTTITTSQARDSDVLVVCRVERGLGDVNWAINPGMELQYISNLRPAYLFYNASEDVVRYLQTKRSEFENGLRITADVDEIRPGAAVGFVYGRVVPGGDQVGFEQMDFGKEEVARLLQNQFSYFVIFHPALSWSGVISKQTGDIQSRIIAVDEYGQGENGSRIFFRDYFETYGGIVTEKDGYVRLTVDAEGFYNRLSGKQKETFDLAYVKELENSIGENVPYQFAYWAAAGENKGAAFSFFVKMMKQSLGILAYVEGFDPQTDSDSPLTFLVNGIDFLLCAKWTVYLEGGDISSDGELELTPSQEEEALKLMKNAGVAVEQNGVQTIYLPWLRRKARIVRFRALSPEAFEYFLLKSKRAAGCTGDMSISQVLSSKRIPVYELLSHKRPFYGYITTLWKGVLRDMGIPYDENQGMFPGISGSLSNPVFLHGQITSSDIHRAFQEFHKRLQQGSFQLWFGEKVRRMVSA
jgi:hypothetical protein